MKSIRYICERQDTDTSPRGEAEDNLEENLTGRETIGESSSSETTSSLGGLMRLHAIHRALQATLRTAAASYF
ncbi:hypothetical protein HZH66_004118 [Vespula vulgaris]|uniref:Uncharacterized protein n=1 Tax=Vespula vulgaris TaxID=7454 RepID=A0A834NDF4_VESVU|nr:hypothetical protein HZH66_004118 [Vespula vulgaris]